MKKIEEQLYMIKRGEVIVDSHIQGLSLAQTLAKRYRHRYYTRVGIWVALEILPQEEVKKAK